MPRPHVAHAPARHCEERSGAEAGDESKYQKYGWTSMSSREWKDMETVRTYMRGECDRPGEREEEGVGDLVDGASPVDF